MPKVNIKVDSQLHLTKDEFRADLINEIRDALLMKNPAREKAKKEQIGGWWNIEEHLPLFQETETMLYVPRGFASQLVDGLDHYKYDIAWEDNRTNYSIFDHGTPVDVRDYQDEAVTKMLIAEQGVWEAPPGAGKTVGVLEAIRRSGQRSLVITDKTNIAEQWKLRAKQFLDADIGIIGDGKWDDKAITVALIQTIWSRREELEKDGWFEKWGFVCLDECHHLPANTFTDILSRFTAKYRIGVSGTPYKAPGMEDLVWNTLGPKIHSTDKQLLRKGGWLVKPSVVIWHTEFRYDFWPTHKCDTDKKKCMYKYCDRSEDKARHQNNYSEMMSAIVIDGKRNELIAHNIAIEALEGHCILVLSKRIGHLKELERLVAKYTGRTDNLFQFTGNQTTKQRMVIQDRAWSGGVVLFSTIADEALDIPRIDRIHLAWPTRNTGTIEQQIGRGERPHPKKKDTIINDYWDRVGPLTGQLRDRVGMVYIPQMLSISGGEDLV